eukprot:3226649-Pyramimonas_sp.AAC.1
MRLGAITPNQAPQCTWAVSPPSWSVVAAKSSEHHPKASLHRPSGGAVAAYSSLRHAHAMLHC